MVFVHLHCGKPVRFPVRSKGEGLAILSLKVVCTTLWGRKASAFRAGDIRPLFLPSVRSKFLPSKRPMAGQAKSKASL
jgi:hypothetical protein